MRLCLDGKRKNSRKEERKNQVFEIVFIDWHSIIVCWCFTLVAVTMYSIFMFRILSLKESTKPCKQIFCAYLFILNRFKSEEFSSHWFYRLYCRSQIIISFTNHPLALFLTYIIQGTRQKQFYHPNIKFTTLL